jgi:hypothetical protein
MQHGLEGGRAKRSARAHGGGARRAAEAEAGQRLLGSARRVREGPAERGSVVAGYRLVRLIGRGERCEVYLAHPAHPPHGEADGPRTVAVKIVPAEMRARGDAEVLALQAVASEHVVRLLDVATLADGALCLVQSLCSRGTAAALIARRRSLAPAEVVTLVASVLRGLGDLHDAGLTHGALDLTHVLIDASGRPVLAGLGSARSTDVEPDPGGEDEEDDRRGRDPVAFDLVRVARIASALRDAECRGLASAEAWGAWLALLDASAHGEEDLTAHDLADRLLDVAEASPLADVGDPDDARAADECRISRSRALGPPEGDVARPQPDPARLRRASRMRGGRPDRRGRRGSRTPARRHRAARVPAARRAVRVVQATRGAVQREVRRVRPRVWAFGGAALVLVAAAALALPTLSGPAHGAPGADAMSATPAARTDGREEATSVDAAADASGGGARDAQVARTADPAATAADSAAVASTDPDAAAAVLLRLRADCLRRADADCLGGVDQPGSPAEDADRTTIRTRRVDGPRLPDLHEADHLEPAQRMGDTALIALRPAEDAGGPPTPERRPASLLVVRGEAGWRIRDLMDDR